MSAQEILVINVFSKNIFFDHLYQIKYTKEKIVFYKEKQGSLVFRFQFFIKLSSIIKWITKNENGKLRIIGLNLKIQKKNKTFITKDYDALEKLYKLLSCKCSFGNFDELYTSKEYINKGSTGKVMKAICKTTGKEMAVKYINKKELTPLNQCLLEQEINIMNKLIGCNYFVQIKNVFQDENYYLIVMNYLEGQSLNHYIELQRKNKQNFTFSQIFTIMKRLFEGLITLQNLGIIHRDIKPQNLVLADEDDFNSLTIIDFGFSTQTNINRYLLYKCGTPGYAAPEILNSQCTYYSYSCDIFSSGCLFYQLLFGELPFKGNNVEQIVSNNRNCKIEFPILQSSSIPDEILNLLKQLLEYNVEQRIKMQNAYEKFNQLQQEYKNNDTEDCQDSSPLINKLPQLEIQLGKVFEQNSTTRISLTYSAQFIIK